MSDGAFFGISVRLSRRLISRSTARRTNVALSSSSALTASIRSIVPSGKRWRTFSGKFNGLTTRRLVRDIFESVKADISNRGERISLMDRLADIPYDG